MWIYLTKREGEVIEHLVRVAEELIEKEYHLKKHKPLLVLSTPDLKQIIMNTTLTLGISYVSSLILVDNVTLQPVSATFTGQTVSSSDASIATFAFDATVPIQVDATPIAVGSGSILLSAVATYPDVNNPGQFLTQTFTASYPFTVVPTPEGLTLSLTDFVPASSTTTSTTTV